MRATIPSHFGKDDRAIKVDTVDEFQAKLKTLSGDHEIYIHENAGHAFAKFRDGICGVLHEIAFIGICQTG